ncbi:hypothetical protein TNCV_2788131 [Trichonephila clavipes]|uniref:Uncharacterized protein n=1 Tax=Trichonephila clavipes TaxID=2585209 RepID=A0A8X6SNF3_TRICX|nr:hypothetical protein TNCV_2788131 [Trichonephila clavipes]
MYTLLIFLFSSLLLISPICLADDYFFSCAEEVLCGDEETRRRSQQCINMLSQKDLDLMFELLNRKYPGTNDIKEVLDEACKDLNLAKENIDYYFEEKNKLDNGYTAEESEKIVTSRACLSLMVGECQVKKAMMGIFGR